MKISAKTIRTFYDRQKGWRKPFYLYLFCVYIPICVTLAFDMKIAHVDGLIIQDRLMSALEAEQVSTVVSVYSSRDMDLPTQQTGGTLRELIDSDTDNDTFLFDKLVSNWTYWLVYSKPLPDRVRVAVIAATEHEIRMVYRYEYAKALFKYIVSTIALTFCAYGIGLIFELRKKK